MMDTLADTYEYGVNIDSFIHHVPSRRAFGEKELQGRAEISEQTDDAVFLEYLILFVTS